MRLLKDTHANSDNGSDNVSTENSKKTGNRHRFYLISLVLVFVFSVSCARIPLYSLPSPLELHHQKAQFLPPKPRDATSPESIIRNFFKATAFPQENYAAARQYLTDNASRKWSKGEGITVIDDIIDIFAQKHHRRKQELKVRATAVGSVDDTGHFMSSGGKINVEMTLVEVSPHRWRIESMPEKFGVVVDRAEFALTYHAYNLFYIGHDSRFVTPDPRWLFCGHQTVPACVIQALVRGPSPSIRNGVIDAFSNGNHIRLENVQVDVSHGVRINLTELSHIDDDNARLIAAQLIWTLSDAGITGPYYISAANVPFISGMNRGMTKNDVIAFDPLRYSNSHYGMYALSQGALWQVRNEKLSPVQWSSPPASFDTLSLARFNTKVAATSGIISRNAVLWIGDLGGKLTPMTQLGAVHTISRPCWSPSELYVWVILDAHQIVRVNVDHTSDPALFGTVTRVKITDFATNSGKISALKISPDGDRMAFIYRGVAYVGSLINNHDTVELEHVEPLHSEQIKNVTSLTWITDDSLILGRSDADVPVLRVWLNGLEISHFPRKELTAPIVGVFCDREVVYVLDSRLVWFFDTTRRVTKWQEVAQFLPVEQSGITIVPIFRE